jgi:hypothetical protein
MIVIQTDRNGQLKLFQRVRDMPLLLRRMIWELMDPQRAIPLVHRTRILFFVWLLHPVSTVCVSLATANKLVCFFLSSRGVLATVCMS